MELCLFTLGAFFYLKESYCEAAMGAKGCVVVTQLDWLPLPALILYMFGFSMGQ